MPEPDPLIDALEALPPASEQQGNTGHLQAFDMSKAIRALTMLIGGASYPQIAVEMSYADPSSVRQLVKRALDRRESESVDMYRTIENARLDADEAELRLIIGNRQLKPETRLRAIDTRTRVSARRARMNGLDAPVKVELSAGAQAAMDAALQLAEQVVTGDVLTVTDEPYDERLEG